MMLNTLVHRSLCAGVLLVGTLGLPVSSDAAGLSISPVVVEIDSPRRAVAVTVTNQGDQAVTFQTEAMVWQQVNGVDQFEPTDELLVVPPIVEVPPNASQIFRVTLRVPRPSPVERTFRLILEDVSEDETSTGQASVAFKFTHNLPVMVAPSGNVSNAVRWKPCPPEASATAASALAKPTTARSPETCIRLFNAGNRRVKVQALTLTGDNWQQALPLKDGVNVLAGAEREWRVPLQAGQTGVLRGVEVQTTRGETLQAETGGF